MGTKIVSQTCFSLTHPNLFSQKMSAPNPRACTESQRDDAFHLLQHPYDIRGKDRQELQKIKHSNDINPHKVSHNPYADGHTNTYDPQAQKVLDNTRKKYGHDGHRSNVCLID